MARLFLVVSVLGVLLVGGCGGGASLTALPSDAEAVPSPRRLRESLRRMEGAAPDSFVVARLRRAGLTPAFGSRFRLGSGPTVGFIPGRHPEWSDELVVVGAEVGTPGGAALLEAARLVAVKAAFTTRPSRTVLVALWPHGTATVGLEATLHAPLWPPDAVASVWVVTGDEARVADVLTPYGHRGGVLQPYSTGTDAPAEAEQLTRAIVALMDREANPAPPPHALSPDSLSSQR